MKKEPLEDIIDASDSRISIDEINDCANSSLYFDNLKSRVGTKIYALLILSLTHENFSDEKAKEHWLKIVAHMDELNRKLTRNVGVSVAAIDYLSNIKGLIPQPKIILEEKSTLLVDAAVTDKLTHLLERNVFNIYLDKEISRYKRDKTALSFLMIDIDDFKKINDHFGHLKGDRVLVEIGHIIQNSVREVDLVARYGGEELSIIMPSTTTKEASSLSERLRAKIANHDFDGTRLTVSMGLSEMSTFVSDKEKLIRTADDALYSAKLAGKNRLVCFR